MPADTALREIVVTTDDGVTLAVRDDQPFSAPSHTVVLLHGFCLSELSWSIPQRLMRREWPNIRIVSFDYRGHGRSAAASMRTYTVDQLADDLAHVLTALDVSGPVVLAGHSMGGMVALTYVASGQRPVYPVGLVLVATAAGRLAQRGIGRLLGLPAVGMLSSVVDHAPHRGADRTVRTLIRPACRTFSRLAGLGGAERAALAVTAADAVQRTALATAAGFLPSLQTYDRYDTLAAVSARTVVVSGGNDAITPVAHAQDLVAGIPGAVHLHAPAAGHMLLHDAPRLVVDAIARTLTPRPHSSCTDTLGTSKVLEAI
jgi:pimeloyl-ACP methyl ester carboxylesterase